MIDSDQLPTLQTERLQLRWLIDSDVPALFDVFSDPEVMRYWGAPPFLDETAAATLLEDIRQHFSEKTLFQWGVVQQIDDRVIGTCTLSHLDAKNRRAEIGFALGRGHWGKGYMIEALNGLFRFAFDELKLHRLEADVDPRNGSSIRLLTRMGFEREGYMRERWLVGEEVCDTVYFGLLAREWRQGER